MMKTTKPLADPSGRVVGEITPTRFLKLFGHLRVHGKPLESTAHKLSGIGRGISWDRPEEQEIAA